MNKNYVRDKSIPQSQIPKNHSIIIQNEIQKSNNHVSNLISSIKKIIHSPQPIKKQQMQKLSIKISIQKDHLKNTFYKINSRDQILYQDQLQLNNHIQKQMHLQTPNINQNRNTQVIEIKQWNQQYVDPLSSELQKKQKQFISTMSKYSNSSPMRKSTIKVSTTSPSNYYKINYFSSFGQSKQDKRQQITIQGQNQPILTYKSYQQNQSNTNNSQNSPSKKIVVSRLVKDNQKSNKIELNGNQVNSRKVYGQINSPTFYNIPNKNQKNYASDDHKDHNKMQTSQVKYVNHQTPIKHMITIRTSQERQNLQKILMNDQVPQNSYIKQIKTSPKVESFIEISRNKKSVMNPNQVIKFTSTFQQNQNNHYQTSYQDILNKNRSRLQYRQNTINSRVNPSNSKDKYSTPNKYQLHIEDLYRKKQLNKSRLYGQSGISGRTTERKKYQIANTNKHSRKTQDQLKTLNHSKISQTSRSKSKSRLSSPSLHTKTIKSFHSGACASNCTRCKNHNSLLKTQSPNKITLKSQLKKLESQFYLVKKYLTPQGQQQCYNFLRSQGIPQKDWPIFVTEYVYRQLSKAYNNQTKSSRVSQVSSNVMNQDQNGDKIYFQQEEEMP